MKTSLRITAALGAFLLAAGVPAAAADGPIPAGVTVTPAATVVDEGTVLSVTAEYDETGGPADGDFVFRYGDGTGDRVAPADLDPGASAAVEHVFGTEGSYEVVVRVPAGGEQYRGAAPVTVNDVAPVLDPIGDVTVGKRNPLEIVATFTDPGIGERHRITFDWGDGRSDVVDPAEDTRTASAVHRYGTNRSPYSASVTVEDLDSGASDSTTFTVTVVRKCAGQMVTIDLVDLGTNAVVGTAGPDVIRGTGAADDIDGGGGKDIICGLGGDDVIKGSDGNDVVRGGKGDDDLNGGDGNDRLSGGPGDDKAVGGPGNDRLWGGGDSDELRGSDGGDRMWGKGGDDLLFGGAGDDVLLGGGGADELFGFAGNDVLHGGPGADILKGGGDDDLLFHSERAHRDTMSGGGGSDAVGVGKRGDLESGIREYLTEDEALAFRGFSELSSFTTYHACCENRVVNIQLMADTVSGHVVMPGEEFSINDVVGERTVAKGYKPAGAIIGGYVQCCQYAENIGGGTSQFGTTFYNAVFFAGMEDIEHRPHTIWFSRYPEGREATMGYPHPDVRFRNITDHPVLITTHHEGYRGRYIEVRFWGDNDRMEVTARKSSRRYTGFQWKLYEPNWELSPYEEIILSQGTPAYYIDVFRDIRYRDGSKTTEKWTVYYNDPRVIETHPCNIPGSGVSCPSPPVVIPPGVIV